MRHGLLAAIIFQCCLETRVFSEDQTVTAEQVRRSTERALVFIEKDAAKWKQERTCSTCHHGTMTAWVYAEALSRGYQVDAKVVAEANEWAKTRLERIDLPRDERPGWSMVNTPALLLATMAQAIPKQDVVSPLQLRKIAGHLLRHQEKDGEWAWSSAPPVNRPPPVFESDEVATRLAYMTLGPLVRDDQGLVEPVVSSRTRAAKWLKETKPNETTQSSLLELLMRFRDGETKESLQPAIDQFLKRQNEDGGWGQLDDRASDAYATGQSLYILSHLGVDGSGAELKRAIAFLVLNQQEDGSWPMIRRGHPGVTPSNFTVPIVYFGSAWGTLGLLRTSP